eukprot:CAMPEP_0204305786 /NCGR_PEP_ID=MMETSP0468-20130131/85102_1 /ASSEMBLY_ACC=CAM_ASM_000383 /TAXON_ID=2969 /ORGANISM="Oxyrrhis marina" /LENGTH=182 /DNA_ID=CAMNT_0051285137 /DNA_START=453 /DNA_END=1002 /DNA_ORIENTATION=+
MSATPVAAQRQRGGTGFHACAQPAGQLTAMWPTIAFECCAGGKRGRQHADGDIDSGGTSLTKRLWQSDQHSVPQGTAPSFPAAPAILHAGPSMLPTTPQENTTERAFGWPRMHVVAMTTGPKQPASTLPLKLEHALQSRATGHPAGSNCEAAAKRAALDGQLRSGGLPNGKQHFTVNSSNKF